MHRRYAPREPSLRRAMAQDPSLRRREMLGWLSTAGGAMLLAGAPGTSSAASDPEARCVPTPPQTEGPYFVDERLERSDLRADPGGGASVEGVPLELVLRVQLARKGECEPLADAVVDLWHCDAQGRYSDVQDPWFGNAGKGFLRGYQRSDASGSVRFDTIYPGWYPGRAVHVHFKVRAVVDGGRPLELTSQLYFDDAVNREVHAQAPYSERGAPPSNDRDGIFGYGGSSLVLRPERQGTRYAARFEIGVKV